MKEGENLDWSDPDRLRLLAFFGALFASHADYNIGATLVSMRTAPQGLRSMVVGGDLHATRQDKRSVIVLSRRREL